MRRILNRQQIQAQKPVVLEILQLDPADESLPAPRGRIRKRKRQTEAEETAEVLRYERTLVAGGLIGDHATIGKPARARFYDGKAFRAQIPSPCELEQQEKKAGTAIRRSRKNSEDR